MWIEVTSQKAIAAVKELGFQRPEEDDFVLKCLLVRKTLSEAVEAAARTTPQGDPNLVLTAVQFSKAKRFDKEIHRIIPHGCDGHVSAEHPDLVMFIGSELLVETDHLQQAITVAEKIQDKFWRHDIYKAVAAKTVAAGQVEQVVAEANKLTNYELREIMLLEVVKKMLG